MILVRVISPQHCQARRRVQPHVLEPLRRGDGIVEGGPADEDHEQTSHDSDAAMALAARDLLAAILATLATLFRRLPRWAVDAGSTGGGLGRGGLRRADGGAERVHQALPRAIVAPRRKVCRDGALGQQIVWEQVPWAACAVEVQDGVEDFSHIHLPRTSAALGSRQQRLQDSPLFVCEVCQIWCTRWGSPEENLCENGVIP